MSNEDWRKDPTALRNYLQQEKGYSDHDLNTLQSETVVDSLQAEFKQHTNQQAVVAEKQAAADKKKQYDAKVKEITDDTKKSPRAKIAELLSL